MAKDGDLERQESDFGGQEEASVTMNHDASRKIIYHVDVGMISAECARPMAKPIRRVRLERLIVPHARHLPSAGCGGLFTRRASRRGRSEAGSWEIRRLASFCLFVRLFVC